VLPDSDFSTVIVPAPSIEEALIDGRITGIPRVEDFDGDLALDGLVARLIDFSHATCAQLADETIGAYEGGRQVHRFKAALSPT
jgi:hypothetical protein